VTTRVTTQPRILVAGIGNIFLGDDAFGCEVLRRLVARPLPAGVEALDFGIRGFDLAYRILRGYDAVVLVDAAPRGGPPGTLYVIEPEIDALAADQADSAVEGHSLSPARVLQLVRMLGGELPRLRLVGCEPAAISGNDELPSGLSPEVAAAVEPAVELIDSLLEQLAGELCTSLGEK